MVRVKNFFLNNWWLVALAIIFAVSFAITPAHASSVIYNANTSPNYDFGFASHAGGAGSCLASGMKFSTSGNLNLVEYVGTGFRVGGGSPATTFQGALWDSSNNLIATSTYTGTVGGEGTLTVDFGGFPVSAGVQYYLGHIITGGDGNKYWEPKEAGVSVGFESNIGAWGNNNSDCLVLGSGGGITTGHQLMTLANADLPPANAIDLTAFLPDTGAGAFWGVNFTSATSTTYVPYVNPYYEIDITAGNTSSTFEGTLVGRKDLISTTAGVATSSTIPALQGFTPGITYYAQAQLIFHASWGDAGVLSATSSIFSFSVANPTIPGYFPASTTTAPTSTISTTNVCDPNAFFLIYGVCRLFVPQASDFIIFNIMKTYVEHKPPFGYIGLTISALQNLGTASSSISFPDLSDFSLVFDPLRTGVQELFWIALVFFLLYKFRHIEL
jgi:hypothetical protein